MRTRSRSCAYRVRPHRVLALPLRPPLGQRRRSTKGGKKSSSDAFRVAQVDRGAHQGSAPLSSNPQPSASNPVALQEVIVTAQKRSEKLTEVPASVTALSAESLQRQGVVSFSDYMTLVPSLADFSWGAEGHGAVILRALNTGYYQFRIPWATTSMTPVQCDQPAELRNIPDAGSGSERYRPFGGSARGLRARCMVQATLGGLIKVVTKKPDLTANGSALQLEGSTVDGGGRGYGLAGNGNLVILPGELALRVSAFDREAPGYMRNPTLQYARPQPQSQGGWANLTSLASERRPRRSTQRISAESICARVEL